jgi:hypothetical protein
LKLQVWPWPGSYTRSLTNGLSRHVRHESRDHGVPNANRRFLKQIKQHCRRLTPYLQCRKHLVCLYSTSPLDRSRAHAAWERNRNGAVLPPFGTKIRPVGGRDKLNFTSWGRSVKPSGLHLHQPMVKPERSMHRQVDLRTCNKAARGGNQAAEHLKPVQTHLHMDAARV